jgi:RimJ/RimL family protein N-acetyltransferase
MTPYLAGTPTIETEHLILRAPRAHDWEAFCAYALSDRAKYIRPDDYDRALVWRGFGHVVGHWVLRGFGLFIVTFKNSVTPLGMTGPWYPAGWPERELGWAAWSGEVEGKGIIYEAAVAARNHAFNDLGWETAVSYIHPDNTRSIALAKRLGAILDPDAAHPESETKCLVYRHPKPEAA